MCAAVQASPEWQRRMLAQRKQIYSCGVCPRSLFFLFCVAVKAGGVVKGGSVMQGEPVNPGTVLYDLGLCT
jgi:hypothetical protein